MTTGDWLALVTVDEMHGGLVQEALAEAGIESRAAEVKPGAYAAVPLVSRRLVCIEVPAALFDEGRACLEALAEGGAEAAERESAAMPLPAGEAAPRASLLRRVLSFLRTDRSEPADGRRGD